MNNQIRNPFTANDLAIALLAALILGLLFFGTGCARLGLIGKPHSMEQIHRNQYPRECPTYKGNQKIMKKKSKEIQKCSHLIN